MNPNDTFSFVGGAFFVPDMVSLSQCYLPIIEGDGFLIYHFVYSLSVSGGSTFRFARLLNHLDMGLPRLMGGIDRLSAMGLLSLYEEGDSFRICLYPPLSLEAFLDNVLYKHLLTKKIGEPAVEELTDRPSLPLKSISKRFSDVFTVEGDYVQQPAMQSSQDSSFDWAAFRAMMVKDQLRFADEKDDVLAIHHLADEKGWDYLTAYRLVRETAIHNQVAIKRLQQKVRQGRHQQGELTSEEQVVVREAKSHSPLQFLTILKHKRKAEILESERQLLYSLAQQGLLDEVLNVLLLYVWNKTQSANIQTTYAKKLANEFLYRDITRAEEAIRFLRQNGRSPQKRTPASHSSQASNVPEWSKEEIRSETTVEGQARMAALREEMLAQESKGSDR